MLCAEKKEFVVAYCLFSGIYMCGFTAAAAWHFCSYTATLYIEKRGKKKLFMNTKKKSSKERAKKWNSDAMRGFTDPHSAAQRNDLNHSLRETPPERRARQEFHPRIAHLFYR